MKLKKLLCAALVSIMAVGCLCVNVGAAETRATGNFTLDISAGDLIKANTSLPMEAGETVTIKASYSPFSASVDYGLIDEDGTFHYLTATTGNIDKSIKISERGNYYLAFRNNSSKLVSISGYVNY